MQIRPYIGADKPAVILYPSGTVISFDELEARANRLAHWFRQAGLREDDVVAILMENNEHVHASCGRLAAAGCTTCRSIPT